MFSLSLTLLNVFQIQYLICLLISVHKIFVRDISNIYPNVMGEAHLLCVQDKSLSCTSSFEFSLLYILMLWVEMMLFVALSDDETAHAEHLAMGGEFVTHLWALLSLAGMHKRDSAQDA